MLRNLRLTCQILWPWCENNRNGRMRKWDQSWRRLKLNGGLRCQLSKFWLIGEIGTRVFYFTTINISAISEIQLKTCFHLSAHLHSFSISLLHFHRYVTFFSLYKDQRRTGYLSSTAAVCKIQTRREGTRASNTAMLLLRLWGCTLPDHVLVIREV